MDMSLNDFSVPDGTDELQINADEMSFSDAAQADLSTSNDDSLSDLDKWDFSSNFGPGDLAALENESVSSVEMDDESDVSESLFDLDDPEIMRQQANHVLETDILRQTSTDLFDITRLLEIEFSQNPLSTQRILIREAAGIYNHYGQHGGYLRLSENILNFLNKGDVVIRPTTRRQLVKRRVNDERSGQEKVIEKEAPIHGFDRATMKFAPPTSAFATTLQTGSTDTYDVEADEYAALVHDGSSYSVSPAGTPSIHLALRFTASTHPESHLILADERMILDNDSPVQPQEYTETWLSSNEEQGMRHQERDSPNIRIRSIKELLPGKVLLNHDHPFTMTNDPQSHQLLDPHNSDALPFYPVDVRFAMRRGAISATGSPDLLNRLFRLTHLNAHHLLNYLTIKYTPASSTGQQSPPAPPFALFRLGIQQRLHSNLKTLFTPASRDALGLTPQVRALLKDLHQNHQWGRGGPKSLLHYYTINEESRNDSWLVGREHLAPFLTATTTTAGNMEGANPTGAGGVPTGGMHANLLNHIERQILQRATGVVTEETFEEWWEGASDENRAWNWLRCWIREMELKKTAEAKEKGKF